MRGMHCVVQTALLRKNRLHQAIDSNQSQVVGSGKYSYPVNAPTHSSPIYSSLRAWWVALPTVSAIGSNTRSATTKDKEYLV